MTRGHEYLTHFKSNLFQGALQPNSGVIEHAMEVLPKLIHEMHLPL
jgi:hypothetical protein